MDIKFRVWDESQNTFLTWEEVMDTEQLFDAFKGKGNRAYQFTGLKDKNGKEICEGDILCEIITEEMAAHGDGTSFDIVEFVSGSFMIDKHTLYDLSSNSVMPDFVVVGNICEDAN